MKKKILKLLIFILFFLYISSILADDFVNMYAISEISDTTSNGLPGSDLSYLGGVFSPLIGIGGSPFIALTMLSGAGSLLNSGKLNTEKIPLSDSLMSLPIANMGVFVILLIFTLIKFILSMMGASKMFYDVTFGKFEDLIGVVCSVGCAFLLSNNTSINPAEVTFVSTSNVIPNSILFMNVIAIVCAALSYLVYILMRTMIAALDVLAFLFSPIPGSSAFITILKHIIVSAYIWVSITNPAVSIVIGLILIIIACFVYKSAKRLELYYRKIYLIPFVNAIFRSRHIIPLIPKRMPRGVSDEFPKIDICIESFFMNRGLRLKKRELCYFIKSGDSNYIFKKRIFGKTIKIELPIDTFIEKPFIFRFLRIFTDEQLRDSQRSVSIVISREFGRNISEIIEKTGLIDYNVLLDKRRTEKTDEILLKTQQMKDKASSKISSANENIQRVFKGFFTSKL